MRSLVVEDDFTCRIILQRILINYGDVDIAANGVEAVEAFSTALKDGSPYELICMDIMMPKMDGQEALKHIRKIERENGIHASHESKIIMVTTLDDPKNVVEAYYKGSATSYIPKPINKGMFIQLLKNLNIIS